MLNRITARVRELLFQILLFCLIAVGVTGLVGYALTPDQLFGWARSARMAVPTALGMLVTAFGLVSSFRRTAPAPTPARSRAWMKKSPLSARRFCAWWH